jgi:thiol-disulfide isomerase/thioredoxin
MKNISIALAILVLASCGTPTPPPVVIDLAGDWRSVIESPGGELPFTLRVLPAGETPPAVALNDTEEVAFSAITVDGRTVTIEIDRYESVLEGELSPDGESITGRWRKVIPGGFAELGWRAQRGSSPRFRSVDDLGLESGAAGAIPDLTGSWSVVFSDDSSSEEARAEFRQQGRVVTGTFLTPTGDYRYLEGAYENGLLRLSTFDGAHVFLFHARAQPDGSLSGDFWSRDSYHATWTAVRLMYPDSGEVFSTNPWQQVRVVSSDNRVRFSFPNLDGEVISSDDPRFAGKVVLVNIFGSWCPNCNDEAPLLAEWSRRWAADGLEVVGLAFEFSDDQERNRRVLRRFAEHHGVDYPLLLAGGSDKTEAGRAVPDLSAVLSYPTTVFIARDGAVRWVHSGFAGPGTGDHHQKLVTQFEETIEALLAEPVPTTD